MVRLPGGHEREINVLLRLQHNYAVLAVKFTAVGKHSDTECSWKLRYMVLRIQKYAKMSGRYSELFLRSDQTEY